MQRPVLTDRAFFLLSMQTVAIQGVAGAFHHEAAQAFFSEPIAVDPHDTFAGLVQAVGEGRVPCGAIAIENTVAGSIHQNYDLLYQAPVRIVGEHVLPIAQHLGALPGTRPEALTEVRSHYMALAQCRAYLDRFPHVRRVEAVDTASSVKEVAEGQLQGVGAIGSATAMALYGLEVIAPNIETHKHNFTRFFIIRPESEGEVAGANKVSLRLTLNHRVGSLAVALGALEAISGNLTKLESMVIPGRPWEYAFYLDIEFDGRIPKDTFNAWLQEHCGDHHLLGTYITQRHATLSKN